MQFLFWLCFAMLAYTFVGYGLLMRTLGKGRPTWRKETPAQWPRLSVVLVLHNEESRVVARLENLLACDYPADKLEVVVVSDGSTDGTAAQIAKITDPRVKPVIIPKQAGKANGINFAMTQAQGEIIVFADARQKFAPGALKELAANFADEGVGAVSGALEINPAGTAGGAGVDLYWRLEKSLRHAEARRDSSIGCTGAIYAVRQELFQPLPTDEILDDVVVPMQVAVAGRRVVFDSMAVAYDPQTLDPGSERKRKRRTLAGNFQMLFRYPAWLLPWRNRLWWQLISHKYLRLVAPLFLAVMFMVNVACASSSLVYLTLFYCQCAFYLLAGAGLLLPLAKSRMLSVPAGFCFLNAMVVAGFMDFMRRPNNPGWAKGNE